MLDSKNFFFFFIVGLDIPWIFLNLHYDKSSLILKEVLLLSQVSFRHDKCYTRRSRHPLTGNHSKACRHAAHSCNEWEECVPTHLKTRAHTHTHTPKSKQACIIHTVTEWNDVWVRAAVSCGPAAKHNKTNNDYIPLWPIVAHFPFSSPPTSRSAFMMRGSDLEPVGVTHPWCILLMSWARDLPTFYVPPAT